MLILRCVISLHIKNFCDISGNINVPITLEKPFGQEPISELVVQLYILDYNT